MSIRQEKFARLLQREISIMFQEKTQSWFEGIMYMVNEVAVSPDLGSAKIYIGFLSNKSKGECMAQLDYYAKDIRKLLATRIKDQVKKIPELHFIYDDTLEKAMKMEELLKKLNHPE